MWKLEIELLKFGVLGGKSLPLADDVKVENQSKQTKSLGLNSHYHHDSTHLFFGFHSTDISFQIVEGKACNDQTRARVESASRLNLVE